MEKGLSLYVSLYTIQSSYYKKVMCMNKQFAICKICMNKIEVAVSETVCVKSLNNFICEVR